MIRTIFLSWLVTLFCLTSFPKQSWASGAVCNCASQTCTSGGQTWNINQCSECNGVCAASSPATSTSATPVVTTPLVTEAPFTQPVTSQFIKNNYEIKRDLLPELFPAVENITIRVREDGLERRLFDLEISSKSKGDLFFGVPLESILSSLTAEEIKELERLAEANKDIDINELAEEAAKDLKRDGEMLIVKDENGKESKMTMDQFVKHCEKEMAKWAESGGLLAGFSIVDPYADKKQRGPQ